MENEWYTTAEFFVDTIYEEVFGIVNIEAQLCGIKVVRHRTGDCCETELVHGIVEFVNKGIFDAIVFNILKKQSF